ncbi:DUF4132 domain-containing protein [Williamsia sp.]|uniref:DUF4132 domain-containing protein n=1 Tax=Williamsia sp. TaxID=1872085 RepID=UPI001A2B2D74|nr:DUF4132 domain-containing protein [Williamsia sp.]MBJ7287507.1 DUF4132 domain-containing protein [Williamsia sp.]
MVYPRRGGMAPDVRPIAPDAADVLAQQVAEESAQQWWALYDDEDVDELTLVARKHLAGEHSAVGAAALYRLLRWWGRDDRDTAEPWVDGWVSGHGLDFAVAVILEAAELKQDHRQIPVEDVKVPKGVTTWSYMSHGGSDGRQYTSESYLTRDLDPRVFQFQGSFKHVMMRMRSLLAVADSDDYTAAAESVIPLITTNMRALIAAFLFPDDPRWEAAALDSLDEMPYGFRDPLLVSTSSVDRVMALLNTYQMDLRWVHEPEVVAAVFDGLGADIVTPLVAVLDTTGYMGPTDVDRSHSMALDLLLRLPSDTAFAELARRADRKGVRPHVLRALRRYPRRAFRLLFPDHPSLFAVHTRANPVLAREMRDELDPFAQRRIDTLLTDLPLATDLPEVLSSPPWTRKRGGSTLPVVDGLRAPDRTELKWLPGELEELTNSRHDLSYTNWTDYSRYARRTSPDEVGDYEAMALFLLAPDELARPLLDRWTGNLKSPMRVVQRYGLEALPFFLRVARSRPNAASPFLLPFVDLEVARLQATAFATRKNLRKDALAWLLRNVDDATAFLIPDALGSAQPERDHAGAALVEMSRHVDVESLEEIATTTYGGEAAVALRAILLQDPLDVLPKRIPKIGDWLDLPTLPPIPTTDRRARLSDDSVGHLLTMCAISKPDNPYPGVSMVTDLCSREELAAFGWEVFERWWGAGAPSKDNWVIPALGWLGDDTTVRRLAPLIRRWPGESGTARAQLGLDALAAIGTTAALAELSDMSRRMKFKSVKAGAAERVATVADRLGLDQEQLGDRIVPDLGLDAAGTMTLTYGSRQFIVGLDESLAPSVTDAAGKRSKSLPKPRADDDPVAADEAKARFAAFKRELKSAATEQIRRLNRAMVIGRRWTRQEFDDHLLSHPLIGQVCQRLLWATYSESNAVEMVFRVAEDKTFADIDDREIDVVGDRIGLVHPAHIPDTIGAWAGIFADYEIMQPFPQLARPVHRPLDDDLDGQGLARFTGVTASPSQALRLTYRGWEPVWDNPGHWGQALRTELNESISVVLRLDPGMGIGSPYDGYPDQTLVGVELRGGRLDEVDVATASELLADLSGFAS